MPDDYSAGKSQKGYGNARFRLGKGCGELGIVAAAMAQSAIALFDFPLRFSEVTIFTDFLLSRCDYLLARPDQAIKKI
ncbi:MAG: hypothetical protein ACQERN_10150 [Thermodesulfobacteriota bacterium]